MNLNTNETEIPEDQLEEYVLKLNSKDFVSQIEGKSKTTMKKTRGQRVLHRQFAQDEVQKEVLLEYPRPVHT